MGLLKSLRKLNLSTKLTFVVVLTLAILMGTNAIITITNTTNWTRQTGQERAAQETAYVQNQLIQVEHNVQGDTKVLANTPGLVDALVHRNVSSIRIIALVTVALLELDVIDVVDAEGSLIMSTQENALAPLTTEKEKLFGLALLGIETTGVLQEQRETGSELHLAATVPLRDAEGTIVGALVASRAINDDLLQTINFSREDIHLALVVEGEIVAQNSPTPKEIAASSPLLLDEQALGLAMAGQTLVSGDFLNGPGGEVYALAYTPLTIRGDVQAAVGILVNMSEQFALQDRLIVSSIIIFIVITLIAVSLMILYMRKSITTPIGKLTTAARQMASGDYEQVADVTSTDEIGQLAHAFNILTTQLQETLRGMARRTDDLEAMTNHLTARGEELEESHRQQMEINRRLEETVRQSKRRAALLQATTQVGRAATQIRDQDRLLSEVTHLISRHFGFYHVGVFILDEAGRYAVLRAANSEGGQRMLARQHRLGVGTTGIVGHVAVTGEPRIALDVGADAVFFDNPDLPTTRSEIAVPLRIGGEIIGVLDVQSTEEAAFAKEDENALAALADQIAIAMENARLLHQTQAALAEAERAQRRYVQREWSLFLQDQTQQAYEYTLTGVTPEGDALSPIAIQAQRKGELVTSGSAEDVPEPPGEGRAALAAPIKIRDEVIGILELQEIDEDRIWNEDEIALIQSVADQLGQALEGARLFQQTQASLAETQALFQTSRGLAAAQGMEEIWRAVVDAARQRQADACAFFLFDAIKHKDARNMILSAGWDKHDSPRMAVGTRIPLKNFGLLNTLRPDQSLPIANIHETDDMDAGLNNLLIHLGFSALLFQPIAVRDRWFGLLTVFYESSHNYSETEVNFYRTLADQAALAIEGQRLLSQTQRRAEREQLIRQITDKVRATPDVETILQTTVQELSKAMGLPRAYVRLGTDKDLATVSDAQAAGTNDKNQPADSADEQTTR